MGNLLMFPVNAIERMAHIPKGRKKMKRDAVERKEQRERYEAAVRRYQ